MEAALAVLGVCCRPAPRSALAPFIPSPFNGAEECQGLLDVLWSTGAVKRSAIRLFGNPKHSASKPRYWVGLLEEVWT
jgi:hypothetical protein